ncbi:GNAT family N-acetyltransferase [Actinophytocola gossypii]|uniref:GNAT family N-acetyltransferase n=1 Tax=Actinophytocola gossypii TaxID=2812003 RepID=A0ABT2JBV2_9PSEU|nr:GNAT family protein [Actinophytocola gossypii]MCT2585256.1 GNAT family N-acetyltransferase [Actinophytocola gossypii]
MTEGTRLRPVTEPDLDLLRDMAEDPESIGVFNWGGFTDDAVWRRRWADNRLIENDRTMLMVASGDETLGFVSWNKISTGQHSHLFELGIALVPDARGRGHGTAAQKLAARYLFAHHPINRIQAWTETGNVAEQRALEKAGFVREAVLHGFSFRDGAWRDEVLYRMLRAELPA